jgi:hypothetical protein
MKIVLDCYFEFRARVRPHGWGILHDRVTDKELGLVLHCKTIKHASSFSLNKKMFLHASRPGTKCRFVYFESIASGEKRVVTIEKTIELFNKAVATQPNTSDFIVIQLSDIDEVSVLPEEHEELELPF